MLKLLAVMLAYPDQAWTNAIPEMRAAILAEPSFKPAWRDDLLALIDECAGREALELQAHYTALFDHGRSTSLHLYEHQFGESRERGVALVALKARYAQSGLELVPGELPDALPVVLEFLSMLPPDEARQHLRDAAEAVRSLGSALAARGSTYAAIPRVLLAWAGAPGFAATAIRPEVPIEAEWSETPVSFSPVRSAVNQVIHWAKKR